MSLRKEPSLLRKPRRKWRPSTQRRRLLILSFEDGEICFKTSIDGEDDRLSPALVKQLVYANVLMVDRYLPGIVKVIYSDVSPAEAVAEMEG